MAAKIERIGIVGLGYVGLPLALAFGGQGISVAGLDTDAGRVGRLNAGESDIEDVPSEELADARRSLFSASTDPAVLAGCDAILICVPTPLANQREPDLSYIRSAGEAIAGVLRTRPDRGARVDDLPGDDARAAAAAARGRGPRGGHRLPPRLLARAHRPRPLRPHRRQHAEDRRRDHRRLRRARGRGLRADLRARSSRVSSPEAAELSKLLENIFRSVNIALVNELAQLTDRLGIDIWEVIDAAATKPFGFMRFEPGPGMGGHCLPIDPFYLAFKAREHDFYTEFVELAGKINQSHPLFCVRKMERALNDAGKPVNGSRVLILGVAYKGGVADLREAPALKIIRHLRELGADVSYHDPHVPELAELGLSSTDLGAGVADADLVAIVTTHPEVDHLALLDSAKLLVDFRGITSGIDAPNLVRL